MIKSNFKKLLAVSSAIIFFGGLLFFAQSALAASAPAPGLDLGLQPLEATGLGHADIRIIIANIIKVALGMLGILAVGLMLYAGYEWMTSGGNEEQIGTAKKILINATIGLAIILSAYSIVAFVMTKLVEATGGSAGVSPKCQAQINSGGPNCDGDCPSCGGGNNNSTFYLVQKPVGGFVCVKNYHPMFLFSQPIDINTIGGHIVVINAASGSEVTGQWKSLVNNSKGIAFFPDGGCGVQGVDNCFETANFKIKFNNASEILSTGGKSLQCGFGGTDCSAINFTTGDKTDTSGPKITIALPVNGDALSQNSTIEVKVNFSDDSGLQNLSLSADGNLVKSTALNKCQTDGQVTVNWPTKNLSLGSHTLNALGVDWAANEGTDSINVKLKPDFCFNNQLDKDQGEKFVDCGGDCGACANDKCFNDSDCASGYCEIKGGKPKNGNNEGVCVEKTMITDFSLPSAAPGDYVSVFGKYFGSVLGHVYFSSLESGKWIEAPVVNCGPNFKNWTNNQVVVSVPAGIVDSGPIKLETAGGGTNGTDITNDGYGPKPGLPVAGNFALSNFPHPGLCMIQPPKGTVGTFIAASGKGFGPTQNLKDNLKFQDINAVVLNWKDKVLSAMVPSGLDNGDFTVQVDKGGIQSNGVKFSVEGVNPDDPFISSFSTTTLVMKDYLTIYGKNFGSDGKVTFKLDGTGGAISGDNSFPKACVQSVWKDDKILIKIPNGMGNGNYTVQVERSSPNVGVSAKDKKISVDIVDGTPAPGICNITPVSSPIPFPKGNVLKIYGDNFNDNEDLYFWKNGGVAFNNNTLSQSSNVFISVNELTALPADTTISGPLYVYDKTNQKKSNAVNFSVLDCTKNNNTCADANDQCCSAGTQNGMCIPKTDTCAGVKHSAGYVWLFSTGGIAPIPKVVERCNAETEAGLALPTPSPATIWNSGGDSTASNVCQTSLVTVEFNMAMDQKTVNANSVKLYSCDSIDGNLCKNPKQIDNKAIDPSSYQLQVASNNANNVVHHYLSMLLANNQKWTANTWYQVALGTDIKSISYPNKYSQNVQFNISANKPCGDGTAYCFSFRTGLGDCKLKQVIVTPNKFWTTVLEEPIRYHLSGGDAYDLTYSGNGLSDQRCIMMNVNGFAWDWSPVANDYTKRLSMLAPSNRLAQFGAEANTVGIGLTNDSVVITATAATTTNNVKISKSADSPLTIDLSNPKVVDYEPKCLEACTDALVSATFNVSMSEVNLNNAVKLYKCNDENCLSTQAVAGVSPTIESKSINDHLWLKIFNNVQGGKSLAPNTLYKVVLSATSTPNIQVGCQGGSQLWSLATLSNPMSCTKPFNQEFSWRFRTKKEACAIDRVEVNPKIFTAQKLDDRAIFVAQPYSAPDACSASGQKLNPFKSDWKWDSSDIAVAAIKSFTTKGHTPYCTSNCLLKGSDIAAGGPSASYPVCGNNKIEAGEDCDGPDKTKNCSLSCLNIVKTKKGSQINTESKDVKASICGNGMVGVDEDCDLGIDPAPAATTSAMFCSANCLHLGTPLSSAWCQAHKDPSDLGSFTKAEFNQACSQSLSRCGDGVEDYNEDPKCDIGSGKHLDSCNDRCLKLSRCTPGQDNPGCSDDKQLLGSSLVYLEPSVCGDGKVGAGEDTTCENVNNFIAPIKSIVDPWVLAIGQGGGKPSGEPPVQFSNITGTTNNKSGVGKYEVECGWKSDLECSSKYNDINRGVGDDSCCYARPQLTKVYPGNVDNIVNNICINTYIEADFDSEINIDTLPGNLLLAKLNGNTDVCATGTEKVDNALVADFGNLKNLAWYQKVWYKVISFVKDIFGDKFAQAFPVWCAGADLATPSVVADGNGGSKIILQLNKALSPSAQYAVVLKPGIKDIKGVSIRTGDNNKPLGWQFVTGDKICEVSSVTIDPDHYAFNIANASSTLLAQAHAQNNQLIVPVPGYAWNYGWGPKVNNFVTVADTTSSINSIISQNRNGEIDVYASANIVDNKLDPNQTGLIGTGRSHIIVFLCENPWPPLKQLVDGKGPFSIFPYEDKFGNNDNFNLSKSIFDNTPIPPSQLINAGYFNFSTYYCADSGASGSITDDLPYLKPAVQVASTTLGSGSFVTSTYIVTSTVVVTSTQVVNLTVPASSTCANDQTHFCNINDTYTGCSKETLFGNTFYIKNWGMCLGTANNNSNYYFDNTGQPVQCADNNDCVDAAANNTDFKNWFNALGVGATTNCINFKQFSSYVYSDCVAQTKVVTSTQIISTNKVVSSNAINSLAKPFNALKRFFFTNSKNNDAIGVQILSNPNHLSARQWFEIGQGFVAKSALQDVLVDDYDAVSDGNNVYVNALNFNPSAPNSNAGNLYTNTYLLSINPDASDETKKVFDQIIKNIKFNINLTNDKRCIVPGNGPTADAAACASDFDCSSGQTCSAQKDKLQRDFKRLQDMGNIFDLLDSYSSAHGSTYPALKAGTYLTGQTVSTWPSWSVLGNAVGTSLPIDPINKLGISGTCGFSTSSVGVFCTNDNDCANQEPADEKCVLHDASTGWSTANQRFSFACPPDSLAYRYIATSTSSTMPGADNYKVKLNWEIIGINNQGLKILNKTNIFNDFVPASDASKFDFNSDSGICNQNKEISNLIIGTCGDGKIGKNEDCDPPGGVKWKLGECSVPNVTANTILHGDICSKICQWSVNATSTTCGAKLSKCGNSLVEVGETCDDGALNGKYGHCNATCSGFAFTCGDGVVSSTYEVCDTKYNYVGSCVGGVRDGQNCSDNFDCNNGCALNSKDPFSAIEVAFKIAKQIINPQGIPQFSFDFICDKGDLITSNNTGVCKTVQDTALKYGGQSKINSCNKDCQSYGPYCGDGIVQSQFGEQCEGNQSCIIGTDAGNRVCGKDCRWKNHTAIVYYNFDDVFVFDDKSNIANVATNTALTAYCSGNLCPAPLINGYKKQSMTFNGSNYFTVDHTSNFDLNELTFSVWINVDPSITDGYHTIVSKENNKAGDNRDYDHNRDYNLYLVKSTDGVDKFISKLHLSSRVFPDNYSATNSSSVAIFGTNGVDVKIPTNEWHFMAVTVDAMRKTNYFVDGNLVGTGDTNGSVSLKADHNYPVKIGRDDTSFFKGGMDELQLYGRALSEKEIKDLYTNSANFCELNSVPVTPPPLGSCGNSKIDDGEVCDKGLDNGKPCVSGYNQSCTYCAADCKNVITVSATGYCGDSIVNGPEKCEFASNNKLYSSATSSGTGFGGWGTGLNLIQPYNGYEVFSCNDEFNITLNASSSYWYNQMLTTKDGNVLAAAVSSLIGKVGTKACAANCGIGSNNPIQDGCVACGLSDKGTVVSGGILNVLDPDSKNPLIMEAPSGNFVGHWGYIDLLYALSNQPVSSTNKAYKVAYDGYGKGDFTAFKLHPANGSELADATIKFDTICSDKTQFRHYRLALNADWSNEHMIDFPVFGITTPDTYNLLLSPVIAQNDVVSTINTTARPNDFRIVVSWVGKDVAQFSAGLVRPTPSGLAIFSPPIANATGTNYFNQPADNGIWFHGFGVQSLSNEEAFTIDTTQMSAGAYAFYIKSATSTKMTQAGKDAKLKVEIYAPEVKHDSENSDVYRHFARPIKTFYVVQAVSGDNPDAQYWHVFNILKNANPTAEYAAHFSVGNQYNSIRTAINLVYP